MKIALTRSDLAYLVTPGAVLLAGVVTGWVALGVLGVGLALLAAVFVVLALQIQHFRRVLRVTELLKDEMVAGQRAGYAQVEALMGLYFSLTHGVDPLPPMRGWAASPDFLRLLYQTVQEKDPDCILELGSGSSTVMSGYALRQAAGPDSGRGKPGKVISLDHLDEYARRSKRLIRQHGLDEVCSVFHAPLCSHAIDSETWQWYDLEGLELGGPIDVVVVDGPPGGTQEMARYPALPLLIDQLAEDAVLLVDDGNREEEARMVARWMMEFPGFEVRAWPTEKGAFVLRRVPKEPPGTVEKG
jgi:predicted O-methyltransferase YrrM